VIIGVPGAEELRRKTEYDYSDFNDYSLADVHANLTLNTY
jgi:hypothetical protein